jgi:hypothetical protein
MRTATQGMNLIRNCPPNDQTAPMTPKRTIKPRVTTPLMVSARPPRLRGDLAQKPSSWAPR